MKSIRNFLELIKFEHTIFALPFAYLGMMLAGDGFPAFYQFIWITIAMASARTLAMGFNRVADRTIDARNPRTANRPLVTGTIPLRTAWGGIFIATLLFSFAAWKLGTLTFRLMPFALIFLIGYSFTKRFTWMSHFILGFTDGLAPAGAWAAVRGSLFSTNDLPAWILTLIVTAWIGGFDLIYACQDVKVDQTDRLFSIPAKFGIPAALQLAKVSHFITILLLATLGILAGLGWPFWIGFVIVIGLLIWEHLLVHPDDLSRISLAFYNINGYISLVLFFSVLASLYV